MRILAIETSGRYGSVAALEGDGESAIPLRQTELRGDERTAQSLAPAMQKLMTHLGWSPQSVELVAVAVGPGSFTGLRIGVTTAKAFAYAIDADVVAVNTLAALAFQNAGQAPADARMWTILDAQRRELFIGQFGPASSRRSAPVVGCDVTIAAQDTWLATLRPGDFVTGPPLRLLTPRLPAGVIAAPSELWQPLATAVGQVGWTAFQSGQRDDVWKLLPRYYRASAAEEKAERKRI